MYIGSRCVALAATFASFLAAQSIYNVAVNTSHLKGRPGKLVFDVTSNSPLTNRLDVINFSTDGMLATAETIGAGPIAGDIIQGLMPAKRTRLKANSFLTELAVPFEAFGDRIEFIVNVSETPPQDNRPPDQFAMFLLADNGSALDPARGTADVPPDFTITITGKRGGKLDINQRIAEPGEPPTAIEVGPLNSPGRKGQAANIVITAGWTLDDPSLRESARIYEGELTEYCNRRCANTKVCTGGAFALYGKDTIYTFDDVGNLKAQVALVEQGRNPEVEGAFGRAKVLGILKDSVLTVLDIVSVN